MRTVGASFLSDMFVQCRLHVSICVWIRNVFSLFVRSAEDTKTAERWHRRSAGSRSIYTETSPRGLASSATHTRGRRLERLVPGEEKLPTKQHRTGGRRSSEEERRRKAARREVKTTWRSRRGVQCESGANVCVSCVKLSPCCGTQTEAVLTCAIKLWSK